MLNTFNSGLLLVKVKRRWPGCLKPGKAVLSINFEVDVPTRKVGGSLLFEHRRRELPRGGLGIWQYLGGQEQSKLRLY